MKSNPADNRLVARLAGAVADGEGVDWPAAHREVRGGELARIVRGLESLAERVSELTSSSGRGQLPAAIETTLPAWFVGYGLLVVLQLMLAAVRQAAVPGGAAQSVAAWTFGLAALVIVQRPPFATRAVALAAAFLSIAGAATELPAVQASRALGAWGAAFRLAPAPELLLPVFLWSFVRMFPHTRHVSAIDRLARGAVLSSGAVVVALWAAALAGVQGCTRGAPTRAYWPALFVLCAPALVIMWLRRREAAPAERRRVALFAAGLAVGIGPLILVVVLDAAVPAVSRALNEPGVVGVVGPVLYLLLLTVPLTTAYATRGGTLLSIPALGRRAAQRALGRATLVSVIGGSVVLAVLLAATGRSRVQAGAVACVASAGLALLVLRRPLWRALGLRGRESWSDLIARLGYELSAQPTQRAASVVETLVGGLLRAPATLMLRAADGTFLSPQARFPLLHREQALPLLLFQERTALHVSADADGGLYACLPDADRDWIRATGATVLVPVNGSAGAAGVLVVAGDDPLDEQDLHGLEAVASALGLALSTRATPDESDPGAGSAVECERCALVASAGDVCACGGALLPTAIPYELNGKFLLRRRLGRGGMGVVYLAVDQQLDREVALKTMPRVTAEAARRLRGEARAMAAVRHPHVAQIHGLETWCGVPVLILEYMSGGMLNVRLGAPMAPAAAVDLAIALASGLEAVHAAGLLHRDVKPSNIGFDATGTPRLLDFGLSRLGEDADVALHARGNLTLAGRGAGTPLYMSPRVLDGEEHEPGDDVWSLLVVLYECLAGGHPLRGVERAHLGRLPSLESEHPEVHAEVSRFVDEALRSGTRGMTAAQLRARLAEVRQAAFGRSGSRVGF